MFLSQNTPEGWRLRRNLFQLILDKDQTNVVLGLQMIQTDDLHFSMFPYIWKLYRERGYLSKNQAQIQIIFEAFSAQFFTLKVTHYVNAEILDWSSHWYKIFEKTTFIELLLEEKIVSWEDLVEYWMEDSFYTKHSCLSRFFLEQPTRLSNDIFIHPHFLAHQLQTNKILYLFELEDAAFNKLAFLKKFVVGNTLNLKNTNIRTIPVEVEQIPNIDILNIYGTSVKELPIALLLRLKKLECNEKTKRAIVRQILTLGRYDYPLAQQIGFRGAVISFERKNYQAAWPLLEAFSTQIQTHFFSKKEQAYFWEMYFSCAVYLEKDAEAQKIAVASCAVIPIDQMVLWKEWRYLLPKLLLAEEAEKLFAVLSPFLQQTSLIQLCRLNQSRKWHYFIENLISKKQFEEAFKLVEISKKYVQELGLNWMNWIRIFRYFYDEKDYASIVKLLEQYQFLAFYKAHQSILPDHQPRYYRCVALWLSSYFNLGDYRNAELYCSILITTFEKELVYNPKNKYYHPYHLANHYIPLACKYLTLIYEKENRPNCVAYFKEKGALICQQYHDDSGYSTRLDYYHVTT